MIIERSMGESLDEETLSIIQNDLVDLEPKLRDLVIKKLQSDGALKAIGLLRRYGGMNLKDAGELVGSWGVDKEGFTVYDSRVAAGEGIVDVELKEQVFPVFGRGPKTQIVVGMTITAYPKGATLAAADKKISALEEDEKRKIPEYILHRELELVAKGDKEGVVSLYEDEADKNFARNERWSDIEKSSSFARNKVKDYSLRTKAKFGPYVFIKYKPLLNNGEAESSSVVLKESKKGYLFSYDLVSKNQLFLIAAEAFPYWKNEKRDNVGDLSRFINTSIKYDSDAASPLADPNSTYPSMQLYCKLRRFSGENSMDASLRKRIKKQLGQLLKGYKTKNPEMIANLWSPSERTKMLNKLKLDENSMNDYAKYFKDVKSIKPEYFLKSGDVLFLYVKPISISGKPKAIELFRFKQQDDEYFLSDLESADSPYVRKILLSREFLAIIEELIKKYN